MDSVTIVVPCYNEEQRLDTQTFINFADSHPHVRFLMVDDGSTDQTRYSLQYLANSHDQFTSLCLETNVGKAEAVRQGVLAALDDAPDMVAYWDADLATPLDACLDFCRLLSTHDNVQVVMGSRLQLLGHDIDRKPLRQFLGRIFATTVKRLLSISIQDSQCGAKVFRVNARTRAMFAEPFNSRWIFDVELLMRWRAMQADERSFWTSVYEQPLHTWRDVPGSKLKMGDFRLAAFELLGIWRDYRLRSWQPTIDVHDPATIEQPDVIPFPAIAAADADVAAVSGAPIDDAIRPAA